MARIFLGQTGRCSLNGDPGDWILPLDFPVTAKIIGDSADCPEICRICRGLYEAAEIRWLKEKSQNCLSYINKNYMDNNKCPFNKDKCTSNTRQIGSFILLENIRNTNVILDIRKYNWYDCYQ